MRIHKLPSEKRNKAIGKRFAKKVGIFIDFDASEVSAWTKSIRVWVHILVNLGREEPRQRGCMYNINHGARPEKMYPIQVQEATKLLLLV